MQVTTDYDRFIDSKSQLGDGHGFDPLWMPDFLFDFQRSLVDWSLRKGRSAIFADCGLGKTPMQLVWAENVVRKTSRPVLILTPLAVAAQTVREADKFGIECRRSSGGTISGGIVATNYEKLHHFNTGDFAGVVCDESSVLKNFDGKTRDAVVEFMRTVPYRLLCTATAAPNDYDELGNSAEALGEMGYQDMIGKFFRQETKKDYLGWGRTKYKIRGYAKRDFWRWVCSWARVCRRPSDLGFEDGRFVLPELVIKQHEIKALKPAPGHLFNMPAVTLDEQREEIRRTLPERCDKVAELVKGKDASVVWCHLNDEADRLEKLIPNARQVSGSDSDDKKEELFTAFSAGQIPTLVTKPVIGAFGLNWQHCAHETFFPSHSFEQYYQAVRRCWRFGQIRKVIVDIVTSEGGGRVMANLQRKADAADAMFTEMVQLMNQSLRLQRGKPFARKEKLPAWL